MKKLLKIYAITTKAEYYTICIESVINGQKAQAKIQFSVLSRAEKKEMVRHFITEGDFMPEHVLFFYDLL